MRLFGLKEVVKASPVIVLGVLSHLAVVWLDERSTGSGAASAGNGASRAGGAGGAGGTSGASGADGASGH